MNQESYLLSVVADSEGDVVHLHADAAGLEALIGALQRLKAGLARGECEHDHFFSESWGGSGLTETMLASEKETGAKQVHHLKLWAWTQEWKQTHAL